jgi:hypothetical protein
MTLIAMAVSSPNLTLPSHLMLDVEHGIGTTKSASLAQANGFSTPTKSVLLFQTNVLQAIIMVTV